MLQCFYQIIFINDVLTTTKNLFILLMVGFSSSRNDSWHHLITRPVITDLTGDNQAASTKNFQITYKEFYLGNTFKQEKYKM